MEHVVFYTGRDHSQSFRRTPSLDEAVRFVESLRNGEGIDDSKVYALSEVPLRFQTYYRVEVPADAAGPSAPAASAAPEVSPPPPAAPSAPAPIAPASPAAAAPLAAEPTAFAPVGGPSFEAVPVGAASPSAPPAAEQVGVDVLPPAPAVETLGEAPADEVGDDAPNEPSDTDVDAGANGKPHRGLGFFAR